MDVAFSEYYVPFAVSSLYLYVFHPNGVFYVVTHVRTATGWILTSAYEIIFDFNQSITFFFQRTTVAQKAVHIFLYNQNSCWLLDISFPRITWSGPQLALYLYQFCSLAYDPTEAF